MRTRKIFSGGIFYFSTRPRAWTVDAGRRRLSATITVSKIVWLASKLVDAWRARFFQLFLLCFEAVDTNDFFFFPEVLIMINVPPFPAKTQAV